MKRYEKLTRNPGEREEAVLAFWEEHQTFEKSLEIREGAPRYVFYEGPPTANGKPHFGHLMPRVYKDLFPRYKTMQGYYVGRKAGWDTHGLPVELEVEKAIGVNSKPEIEEYGVEKFVELCKESVWKYKADWERMMLRMGFWIDFEDAYVTYTDGYIETVWWELKQMFDRGLLYQGHKTLPYCPRCGTGLSSHEVAQGYKTVEDPTVTLRLPVVSDTDCAFDLEPGTKTSILTWTTTPWTLPANVGAAVAEAAIYVEVAQGDERLILVKELVEKTLQGDYRIVREFGGAALVGLKYEPPYALTREDAAHRIYAADFVNLEDGTGIVHIASAFGEDDYQLGQQVGLPFVQPVDLAGRFTEEFPLGAGEFVKDVDERILNDLMQRGLLYRSVPYEHDYPFCWRCDTPLLYYARDSWYIRTTDVKDELIANNASIHWYPAHVGEGRLAGFLANLKDWALSRDRFWGTPLNLWVCEDCEHVMSVGSREELVSLSTDPELAGAVELHRPSIDRVSLRCAQCGGTAHRVPYVIDTWFDSGSMHSAQWHYPFENEAEFKSNFPADFICEAMEQTRGWFYTLLATSTIIHGRAPFKHCIGTGLGLDGEGIKMSKSKGNVTDPWDVIGPYGADCVRWYLYSSSAPWKSKRLGEADVKEPLYRFLDTLRNTYDFFALYANIDGFDPEVHASEPAQRTLLDRWLLSRLAAATEVVTLSLDQYDVLGATGAIEGFVDELSNWYVRLSRRRFWRGGMGSDKIQAYHTLRTSLVGLAKLLAPFVPFLSEAVFRELRLEEDPESVHLCRFPEAVQHDRDEELEQEMEFARTLVALGHQTRNQAQIRVRQPLARMLAVLPKDRTLSEPVLELLKRELNVESIEVVRNFDDVMSESPVPNFRTLGPRLGADRQVVGAWIKGQSATTLHALLADGPAEIALDGKTFVVNAEDVAYEATLPVSLILAEDAGLRVLLDTAIDERLATLGSVRELTHRVQLARKNAGFEVTDRIVISYDTTGRFEQIIEAHRTEIAEEILAIDVRQGALEGVEHTEKLALDDEEIVIYLRRAERTANG